MAAVLTLTLSGGRDSDERELDELTRQLRGRLLELDVESAELVRHHEIPVGAKPGEVVALGAIAVQLAPHLLPSVVALLTGWLKGRPVGEVEMAIDGDTIKVSGVSLADQQEALRFFLDRHAKPS
jgi:hypothetical protein